MSRIERRDVAEAAVSSAVTFAWYAMADAVRSRASRAVLKTVLMVPLLALSAGQMRRMAEDLAAARGADGGEGATTTDGSPGGDLPTPGRHRALSVAAALVVLAGAIAGTAATERAIHGLGERRRARGARLPHARIGLVSAVAMAGISLASATAVPREAEPAAEPAAAPEAEPAATKSWAPAHRRR